MMSDQEFWDAVFIARCQCGPADEAAKIADKALIERSKRLDAKEKEAAVAREQALRSYMRNEMGPKE